MDAMLSEYLKKMKEQYGLIIDSNTLYSGHTHTMAGSFDATNTLENFIAQTLTNGEKTNTFGVYKTEILSLKDLENNKTPLNVKSIIFVTDHDSDRFFTCLIHEYNFPADIPAVVVKKDNDAIILGRGIEQTISVDGSKQHLLVYFPDPTNIDFYKILSEKENNNKDFDYHYFYAVNDILENSNNENFKIHFTKDQARVIFEDYKQSPHKYNKEVFIQFSKNDIINIYCNELQKNTAISKSEIRYFNLLMKEIMPLIKEPVRLDIPADYYIPIAKKANSKLVWAHPNGKCANQNERDTVAKKLYDLGIHGEEEIYSQCLRFDNNNEKTVIYSSGADSHHSFQPLYNIKAVNYHKPTNNTLTPGKYTIHALDYPLIMNDLLYEMQQRKNSNKVLPEEAIQPFPRFFSETKAKLVYEKCKNKAKDIFVKSKRKDENLDDLNI